MTIDLHRDAYGKRYRIRATSPDGKTFDVADEEGHVGCFDLMGSPGAWSAVARADRNRGEKLDEIAESFVGELHSGKVTLTDPVELQAQLADVKADDVWHVLLFPKGIFEGIGAHIGPARTGDAQLSETGTRVERTADGNINFRVTLPASGGLAQLPDGRYRDAFFDEFTIPADIFDAFAHVLRERLRQRGWGRIPE